MFCNLLLLQGNGLGGLGLCEEIAVSLSLLHRLEFLKGFKAHACIQSRAAFVGRLKYPDSWEMYSLLGAAQHNFELPWQQQTNSKRYS